MIKRYIVVLFAFFSFFPYLISQQQVVDQVVAVVGGSAIFQSDIENQYQQFLQEKMQYDGDVKCSLFEELLVQKYLLNQAKIDSIEVSDEMVKGEIDSRIENFISVLGSKEKVEEYFKKSIFELKEDQYEQAKEYMLTQKMRQDILKDITVTPSDVAEFYAKINKDSLPIVESNLEYNQIVLQPAYKEQTIFEVKQKLLDLRKRIIDGEKFTSLARLYSEDGASRQGGELGFLSRSELDPEYGRVAFGLKEGGISTIVQSSFGFHIVQLIERKGDRVNTRHIIMKPKAKTEDIEKAVTLLDSIVTALRIDSLSLSRAAFLFSTDEDSKYTGGVVINKKTNSAKFDFNELSVADQYYIKKLKVGEYSEPFESVDDNSRQVFKIVYLKKQVEPHKANLTDDYQMLQQMAIGSKRQEVFDKWLKEKQNTVYVEINSSFKNCPFKNFNFK